MMPKQSLGKKNFPKLKVGNENIFPPLEKGGFKVPLF
jgi:hypothetical protein